MNCKKTASAIETWITEYALGIGKESLVVGVSGGIDSAVVSTLCANTALTTRCALLPIHQNIEETDRGSRHCQWLMNGGGDVRVNKVDLTSSYSEIKMSAIVSFGKQSGLSCANLRSRLRMAMLYMFSNNLNGLVVGTGNKIEDYGVGFCTRYGDTGVDINPIGSLLKSQVFELAAYFGINKEILNAKPTDGLWSDGRDDESQLGNTYSEFEDAMSYCEHYNIETFEDFRHHLEIVHAHPSGQAWKKTPLSVDNYIHRHATNSFKMKMPPIGPEPI